MTHSKQELSGLVERVRGLKGADAVVDAQLYATIGGAPHTANAGKRTVPLVRKGDPSDWPSYTASVDAALALVERVLGADSAALCYAYDINYHCQAHAEMAFTCTLRLAVGDPADMQESHGQAPTLPLAILLALLLSLQSQEPTL